MPAVDSGTRYPSFSAHGFGLIEQVERATTRSEGPPVGSRDEVDTILADGFMVTSSARPQCGSAPTANRMVRSRDRSAVADQRIDLRAIYLDPVKPLAGMS
jgi:hypothetical protein